MRAGGSVNRRVPPTTATCRREKRRPGDGLAAGGSDPTLTSAPLDRMLDLMLVRALRGWFDAPDAGAPAWCRALEDPVVGGALRLMHDAPAHSWTVADLATEFERTKTGVDRMDRSVATRHAVARPTGSTRDSAPGCGTDPVARFRAAAAWIRACRRAAV